MGRPKGKQDTQIRIRRKNRENKNTELVTLSKVTFFVVLVTLPNGDIAPHFFDDNGNEYVSVMLYENLKKKVDFEYELAKPTPKGGD